MFTHGQSRVLSARPISPVHLILPDSLTALTQPLPPKHCAAQGPQAHLALLCMAADRALDALGVRGASGGPSYCCPPPAAPPHQQVPTWGRPIHEVGAVGRRGEVERGGGGMAGEGGRACTPTPPIHPSFSRAVARAVELEERRRRRSLSGLAHTLHCTVHTGPTPHTSDCSHASCVLRFSTDSYFNVEFYIYMNQTPTSVNFFVLK